MIERTKSQELRESAGQANRPHFDEEIPRVDKRNRSLIGLTLRRLYDDVRQGVPEQFAAILRGLDDESAQADSVVVGQQHSLDAEPPKEVGATVEEPPERGRDDAPEPSIRWPQWHTAKVWIASALCAAGATTAFFGLLVWITGLFEESYPIQLVGTGAFAAGTCLVALMLLAGEKLLADERLERVAGGQQW